jgi:hypothetical protein
MVVLAIAGPVLYHAWFIAEGFPTVVAAQAQALLWVTIRPSAYFGGLTPKSKLVHF